MRWGPHAQVRSVFVARDGRRVQEAGRRVQSMSLAPGEQLVPDSTRSVHDLVRTATHVAVVAHPDDLELVTTAVLADAAAHPGSVVFGIVCTDGAGAGVDPDARATVAMQRASEQAAAARVGGYDVLLLGRTSAQVRESPEALADRLAEVLAPAHASLLATHDPFDRHSTHASISAATVGALRRLPGGAARVVGCEGWRSLDWLHAQDRLAFDMAPVLDAIDTLAACFPSQLIMKPYDRAVPARWQANAIFADAHQAGGSTHVAWALDLTELCRAEGVSLAELREALLQRAFGEELG